MPVRTTYIVRIGRPEETICIIHRSEPLTILGFLRRGGVAGAGQNV